MTNYTNTTIQNNLYPVANGTSSSNPFVDVYSQRNPTTTDVNYPVQKKWFNTSTGEYWILQGFSSFSGVVSALWKKIAATGSVEFLEGNTGGAVGPDSSNIIHVIGDGTSVEVSGSAATNTLTISTGGGMASLYTEDSGTAAPSSGNLNVLGTTGASGSGSGVSTSGSGSTISVQMHSPFSLSDFVFSGNTASTPRSVTISNLSNTASSDAVQIISVGGASGGDPYTEYRAGTNHSAVVGYQNAANEFIIGTGANGVTPQTASAYFLLRPSFPDILFQVPSVSLNVSSATGALFTVQNQSLAAGSTAIINLISGGLLAGSDSYIDFTNFTVTTNYAMGHQASTDNFVMAYSGAGTLSGGLPIFNVTNAGAFTHATSLGFNQSLIANTTAPGAYPYAVLATDYFIRVDTSASPKTIDLPNAPSTGQVYIIKDATGNANAQNITLTTVGGVVTIDGAASVTMSTNYQTVRVIFTGSAYLTW